MRLRSLYRLTGGLTVLALSLLTAPAVAAQTSLISCGGGTSGGGGGGGEGWVEVGEGSLGLIVSDALTGEKLWPLTGPAFFPITPNPGSTQLDLRIDTNEDPAIAYLSPGGILFLPARFYVLTFELTFSGQLLHVAWSGSGQFGPDSQASPYSFYEPIATDGNIDTCFVLDKAQAEIQISTHDVELATGFGGVLNDVFGNTGWTLPYDAFSLCPAQGCSVAEPLNQFVSYRAPVVAVPGQGYRFVPDVRFATAVRLPATYPAQTWDVPGLRVRFAPAASLTVGGVLNVSGTTLTAADAARGWGGVRFNPGSGGTWTGMNVERVAGEDPLEQTIEGHAAVTVTGASPTFTDLILQDPLPGSILSGLSVTGATGHTTAPVATRTRILNMTGRGITVNGAARLDLRRGIVSGSDGVGLTTSGGSTTRAYLVPFTDGTDTRGPLFTLNDGGGIAAGGASEVRFGTDSQTVPGYGLASVISNDGRGLFATGGALIDAGSGTVAAGARQRNRVFNNLTSSATGNGLATGTSSRVYARCAWWNTTNTALFRVAGTSGGLLDASYYLTTDPYTTANPTCTNQGIGEPGGRPGRGSVVRTSGTSALRGTLEAEGAALDRLAEAMSAGTAAETVSLLASLVAEWPETDVAAAALGEAGVVAGRAGAPATAAALLSIATTSGYTTLRVAAWQGLVASRRATGDRAGALLAADALALEGGAALVQAEVARVYLHAEAGDSTAAFAALGSLEALAPVSVEADLARAFLGLGGTPPGRQAAGTIAAEAGKATADAELDDTVTLALWPNPASSGAAVTLTLTEAAEVAVTVYDLLGRAVQTPLAGALAAGLHQTDVDVSRLAPGVYVVRAAVNTAAGTVVRAARLTVAR